MSIQETRDKDRLRRLFARDPIGAIYMLGDLEESAFCHCRWYVDDDRGVLLLYAGLAVPVVLPFGDAAALVREVTLPDRFYTKVTDAERRLFSDWELSEPEELYVMGLRELIRPSSVPGLRMRLISDPALIEPLYSDYPGNYFSPEQVPYGLYAAAEFDGRIVAAGGTHAWARDEGAAALGNIVTAAAYRGQGIGRALVAYLCDELQARGCRHIGLHVHRLNRSAVNCYRSIGFTVHSEITQWTASREGLPQPEVEPHRNISQL